jgi:outer membrane protein OmpA-like peptidoglycan-associated protein
MHRAFTVTGFLAGCVIAIATAQAQTADQIISRLATQPAAIAAPPTAPAAGAMVMTRGLSIGTMPAEHAPTAQATPSNDKSLQGSISFTNIKFGLDSAVILPGSKKVLQAIGEALSSPQLAGFRFRVIGHTDSRGSADHNLSLSKSRAAAVAAALTESFGINPARLEVIGMGSLRLSDPEHPLSAKNRRVELVNIGAMP